MGKRTARYAVGLKTVLLRCGFGNMIYMLLRCALFGERRRTGELKASILFVRRKRGVRQLKIGNANHPETD
jgi:hypothetical protein